jgi:hypothetical protein
MQQRIFICGIEYFILFNRILYAASNIYMQHRIFICSIEYLHYLIEYYMQQRIFI